MTKKETMNEEIDRIFMCLFGREELTEEERRTLDRWTAASGSHARLRRQLEGLLEDGRALSSRRPMAAAYEDLLRRARRGRTRRLAYRWASVAAVAALTLGGWLLYFSAPKPAPQYSSSGSLLAPEHALAELILPNGEKRTWRIRDDVSIASDTAGRMYAADRTLVVTSNDAVEQEPKYYTISIPYGAEYNLRLPDSTVIFLNAGTTLRYPDRFTGGRREVFLSGEAYFQVASDSLHPFVVCTDHMHVRVLGTSFNVKAYAEEKCIQTTLEEGRVDALCAGRHIVMTPGTQVAFNKTTRQTDYRAVNTTRFTSWKDGYYDFEEMPLGELMKLLARWYDVKFSFTDSRLGDLRFSGRLKRYEDAAPLFKMLEYTEDIEFVWSKGSVLIRGK